MKEKDNYPEAFFQVFGFSEDPIIKEKEIQELKDKSKKMYKEYLEEKSKNNLSLKEYETKLKLIRFEEKLKFQNVKIELKNNEFIKYYMVKDGTIFKYDTNNYLFYRLNMNKYKWEYDPTLIGLYNDSHLQFKEIYDFKDYFETEDLDLDKGRYL